MGIMWQTPMIQATDSSPRTIISLDGMWQVEGNDGTTTPADYPHAIPVPGVVKLAKPGWGRPLAPLGQGNEATFSLFAGLPDEEKAARRKAWVEEGKKLGFPAFWYRRTVILEGAIPDVALLRVNKARWGVKAWVNGQEVGGHALIRTAGIFDVRKALKGGGAENEILLCIGGRVHEMKADVPKANPWSGTMPGIYDSVSLILSGTPRIVRTQAVPLIEQDSVRFVGLVRNTSSATRETDILVHVRHDRSDTILASSHPMRLALAAGEEKTFDCTLRLPDPKLWSPQSPHLYAFSVTATDPVSGSPTDQLNDRFGMREFRIHPETGAATLNGQHIFLRGTGVMNITDVMEHPLLDTQPWTDAWIRRAYQNIIDMNGFAARAAFDFMPERWYEIADEMGILIQDEALSGARGSKPEALIQMFTQWIHERANHPSVIIWDASNETYEKTELHPAIAAVRHYDLSRRPWDCSWAPTGVPGDVTYEAHPYPGWSKSYSFASIEKTYEEKSQLPNGLHRDDALKEPLKPGWIVNEFCGVFLRSGGTVSDMFPGMFLSSMDKNASPDDRLVVRGRYQAAEYEVRRRKPGCIGLLWNPLLHASDRYVVDDITIPRIERHFARFVKDASAPVGVCLAFFDPKATPGETKKIPVGLTNDTRDTWNGTIRVAILTGERNLLTKGIMLAPPESETEIAKRIVAEWSATAQVATAERIEISMDVTFPAEPGLYHFLAEIRQGDGPPVRSWREFAIP